MELSSRAAAAAPGEFLEIPGPNWDTLLSDTPVSELTVRAPPPPPPPPAPPPPAAGGVTAAGKRADMASVG